ncbi:hypothetical protein P4S72_18250 [Vibrio sp. PP-XX7]
MANPVLQDKEQTLELDRWLKNQAKTVKNRSALPLFSVVLMASF